MIINNTYLFVDYLRKNKISINTDDLANFLNTITKKNILRTSDENYFIYSRLIFCKNYTHFKNFDKFYYDFFDKDNQKNKSNEIKKKYVITNENKDSTKKNKILGSIIEFEKKEVDFRRIKSQKNTIFEFNLDLKKKILDSKFRTSANQKKIHFKKIVNEFLKNGEILNLSFLDKVKIKKKVVIYLDVSKSMSEYYNLYFPFLKFIQNILKKNIDVFLISTNVETLVSQSINFNDFTGTHFAKAFENHRKKRAVKGHTMIIISDGFDASKKNNLDYEMKIFKSKFKKIFWFNPLMRFKGFKILTENAKILKNNSTKIFPGHNLNALTLISNIISK